MSNVKRKDIIRLLKNSSVSILVCSMNGTIEYCDKKTKKRLIGSSRGTQLEGKLLNEFIEVCYPPKNDALQKTAHCWIQVWKKNTSSKSQEEDNEKLNVIGIQVKSDEENAVKILYLVYPFEGCVLSPSPINGNNFPLKILEQFSILVIQIDPSGNVLFINDYIKKLTGWLPSEVIGKNWFDTFIPDEIREETIQFLHTNSSKTGDILFEGEILTKQKGRLLMLWVCMPIQQEQGTNYILMLGQELSTPHRDKLLMRGIRIIKNQFQWLCENLVYGIPEEEAFSKILHNALEITSMEAGVVFKVVSKEAILIASEGLEEKITKTLQRIPINNLVIETILSNNDIKEISSLVESFPVNLRERGFARMFAIPVRTGETATGCIVLATTRKDMLDEEILPLLHSISCEIGWLFLWYGVQELQRRQGRQYELLERMLPYALISVDERDNIIGCNRGGFQLLGANFEEELTQYNIHRFIPEWEKWKTQLGQTDEMKSADIQELEIINLKGETIPAEFILGHFSLASRSFYLVFLRDIRWRKQAIETIQKAEERFREIFENANDIIYTHDLNGRFTSLNKAGLIVTGYSKDDIPRMNVFDIVPEEYHEEVKEKIRKKLEGAPPTKYELEIIAKDGHRIPIEVSTRIIYEKGKPIGIQGIARDITDRKRAEEEQKKLELQILHAQKLESLGVLAGGIAHDFNNILVGIMGNVGLALSRLPEDSPVRSYLKRIEESSHRAAELTKQMLAYSGKGVIMPRPLNLSRLINEMQPLLTAVVSKKAIVEYKCPDDVPAIYGDAIQLHQVLMNLVTNASEALGETAGKIIIQISVVELTQEHMKESYFYEPVSPGKYVCLEVSDTGCGMDKETLTKIFDPFFSTKFAGRGLGLASVLGIVRGHKGTVNVYSEPNKGTCFKVYFPVSEASNKREVFGNKNKKELEETFIKSQNPKTILLVNDEEGLLEVANETLSQFGYKTILARNGKEALELFELNKNNLSAIVLDLTMPELDGLEVFQKINKIDKNIPIILCSGFPEQSISQQFGKLKPSGFIQKPYRPIELVKLLGNITRNSV